MNLNLKNPIAFFDLETTGINISKDRIVEISIIKVHPNGEELEQTYRVNPEMHIPEEASAVHGLYDDDLKDCPTFKEIAKTVAKFIEGCDLGGFNSNKFDIPLLAEEFLRVGVDIDLRKRHFVDVQNIFHKMEKRTLVAAYKFYCHKELEGAHGANADTRATYEVLKAQLDRYSELENDIASLAEFTTQRKTVDYAGFVQYNADNEEIYGFGKNKGKRVVDVMKEQPGYMNWVLGADFPLYTKKVLTEIKLREAQK